MRNITGLMNRYRECSRHLWNEYFSSIPEPWEVEHLFEQARKSLFEALVVRECVQRGCCAYGGPMPILHAVPIASLPILIHRLSADGNRYWDEVKDMLVDAPAIRLKFEDYYDYSVYSARNFGFYRCKIVTFPSHVQYEGREALIEVEFAEIFVEDASVTTDPAKAS